jgi:hypothetical protein
MDAYKTIYKSTYARVELVLENGFMQGCGGGFDVRDGFAGIVGGRRRHKMETGHWLLRSVLQDVHRRTLRRWRRGSCMQRRLQ